MARTVSIGKQDFEKVRIENCFYVDKTDFIRQWWERGDDVTLITRPRRFGKTLNMSMVECFFSVAYQNRGELFEGLSIWKHEKYRRLQGNFPVISLSFANIKEKEYISAKQKIRLLLADLYGKYTFLLKGSLLAKEEKEIFRRIAGDNLTEEMPDAISSLAIQWLSGYLSRFYEKRVIILLDEYDTPLQESYVNEYWEELSGLVRNLLNATFKTNPYLERGILTGITRVSRESIFSDLNNLKIVTTTSEEYADCFGFNQNEVAEALREYGLEIQQDFVKDWYDGFQFGKLKDIYNPWSIINYLDTKRFCAYWANTSSNDLVSKLIREGSAAIKSDFEALMKGQALEKKIDEQIVFSQLLSDEDAVWSLLLAAGYLKANGHYMDAFTYEEIYRLSITNREVHLIFRNMVRGWFAGNKTVYNAFVRAMLEDDLKAMNAYMNQVALTSFSFFDSGKSPSAHGEPERFYHGFVLGLMVELAGRYVITSNRESGFGRYDVMLEPLRNEDAVIMEFKVREPAEEKSLSDTAERAILQIREKKYAAALMDRGIPAERIRYYGFAFEGKRVLIGKDTFELS